MSTLDLVHHAYPVGLGSTYETVRQFLVVDAATLAMWDEACGSRQGERADLVDNVNEDKPERPTGNSAQAAVRRLRKAADSGDTRAFDLLAQVATGVVSPNAAAVEMGWRPKMVSLLSKEAHS